MKKYMMCLLIILLSNTAFGAEKIRVLTEEWPPYNYVVDGTIVGISTDLVKATLDRAGVDYQMEVWPWRRAYITALEQPNTFLFTTSRTKQRESLFKWIGPLYRRQLHLYKLKSRTDIQVNGLEDLKKYEIGVLRGGSVEEFLKSKGFKEDDHLWPVTTVQQNLLKVFLMRIDLIVGSDMSLSYRLKDSRYKFADLEKVFLLDDQGAYFIAANKETPDEMVQRLQTAFDDLIKQGLRERIRNKYLKWHAQ